MADKPSDEQIQQAVKMGISATRKGDYKSALKVFKAVYGNPALKPPAEGLSYYGLAIAIGENKTSKGVDLCREAIKSQFFEGAHHANLVKLHLEKGNRKSAEEALTEGLGSVQGHKGLEALAGEMGIPVNSIKKKSKGGGSGLDLKALPGWAIALAGLLFFAVVFGSTFFILYRQAYGP